MNMRSTAGNYYRASAHVGVRQRVARRRALDLPGGLLLWKELGKVMLWVLPVILAVNLWCSSAIETASAKNAAFEQALLGLEQSGAELRLQKERLLSPVRVKLAAAEKFSLFAPEPGQLHRM